MKRISKESLGYKKSKFSEKSPAIHHSTTSNVKKDYTSSIDRLDDLLDQPHMESESLVV